MGARRGSEIGKLWSINSTATNVEAKSIGCPNRIRPQRACELRQARERSDRAINNKVAIITETEAYPESDEASHSFRGKTERNKSMFLRAGYSYVYLIYGIHHCLNIVTEKEGVGSAVLIRSVILKEGEKERYIEGPGRVCKELKISKKHDGIDLLNTKSPIFIADVGISAKKVRKTERVGISKGKDKKWRFIAEGLTNK